MIRRPKRITVTAVSSESEFILDGKSYTGIIENVSEEGVFIKTALLKKAINSTCGIPFELKFDSPWDEKVGLYCKMRWLHSNKIPTLGLTYGIGARIINPSPQYKKFLKTMR